MKKFKINVKLTVFLVSLFLSLVFVILGNKNNYCLSFGFMLMGVSLVLFAAYRKENIANQLEEINQEIDELSEKVTIEKLIEDDVSEEQEETVYVLRELKKAQKQIKKKKTQSMILFNLSGVLLVVLGFINLF